MTFQEIDYHVLLFKAYLEPEEVRFEFLDLAREKTGYSENAFLAKLDQALKTLKSAFEYYLNDHKFRLRSNFTDLQVPISMLNRWPGLENFSVSFQGHLSEGLLEKIDSLLLSYKFKLVDRLFERKIQELETSEPKQKAELKPEIESNPLESIWMKNPSISVKDFLEKGLIMNLWDEEFNLIAKRNGLYGSKKILLANLYIALKGTSIDENIDHKKVGSVFCNFFKIENDPNTEKPFKSFERGNPSQVELLKKRLK